jgi:hypothetical protein
VQGVEGLRRGLVHALVEVPVQVHCRPDGRVAEPNLNRLRVHAAFEDRRVRVSEIVGVAGEADRFLDCLEPRPAPEVLRPQRRGALFLCSRFDQPEGHFPMEGAQSLALPRPPGAPGPGAVQRAGVATNQCHVLGAGPPQGGGPLAGVPVVGGPDAAGDHRRGNRARRGGDAGSCDWTNSSSGSVFDCAAGVFIGRFIRPSFVIAEVPVTPFRQNIGVGLFAAPLLTIASGSTTACSASTSRPREANSKAYPEHAWGAYAQVFQMGCAVWTPDRAQSPRPEVRGARLTDQEGRATES